MQVNKLTKEQIRQEEAVFLIYDLARERDSLKCMVTSFTIHIADLFSGVAYNFVYAADQAIAISTGMDMEQVRSDARCLKLKSEYYSPIHGSEFTDYLMALHRLRLWVGSFDRELAEFILLIIGFLSGTTDDFTKAQKQIELISSRAL